MKSNRISKAVSLLLMSGAIHALYCEEVRSLSAERRDVLRFGIDTEIIELIGVLKGEEDSSLAGDILEVLEGSRNVRLREAALGYFAAISSPLAEAAAFHILTQREEEPNAVVIAALNYLRETGSLKAVEIAQAMIRENVPRLRSPAVRYLGRSGRVEAAEELLELFDDPESNTELRIEILQALGELRAVSARERLIAVLDDEEENATLRRVACEALGRIGGEEVLPPLRRALASSDNLLRAAAVVALSAQEGEDHERLILDALRDSFWRVREAAAVRAGEKKMHAAVQSLIFRVRRDAERRVRLAALEALAVIGGREAIDFLNGLLVDQRAAQDLRVSAGEQLVARYPESSLESIRRVMEQEWQRDRSVLLDAVCKAISRTTNPVLGEFIEKMLGHPNFIIKIYGIRAAQRNGLGHLKERIRGFDHARSPAALRRAALEALSEM